MALRYIGLFLLTGAGGIASGVLWLLPSGLMGGALGMALTAGVLWLGLKQRRENNPPSDLYALATGAAAGLLGGGSMAAISALCSGVRHIDFGPPRLPYWAPLLMGVGYGVVLIWCYHRRLRAKRALTSTLLRACGYCFLLKMAGALVYVVLSERNFSDPAGFVFGCALLSLLGAVPFALFWVLATAWLDPAWVAPGAGGFQAVEHRETEKAGG
jgi:hypothetical protein